MVAGQIAGELPFRKNLGGRRPENNQPTDRPIPMKDVFEQ
jgi:hypothetical protein